MRYKSPIQAIVLRSDSICLITNKSVKENIQIEFDHQTSLMIRTNKIAING